MFSFFKKKKNDVIIEEEIQEKFQEEQEKEVIQKLEESVVKDEAYANPIEVEKEETIQKKEALEEIKEEKKSFFSRALEKTFASIKTVVPQKKRKNIF